MYVNARLPPQRNGIQVNVDKRILQYLVELRDESIRKIAAKIGLNHPTLSRFLNDRPGGYLGYEKLLKLLDYLGLEIQSLEEEKKELKSGVHLWVYKPRAIKEILSYFFPEGGERIDCMREELERESGFMDLLEPLMVLFPKKNNIRIILIDPPFKESFLDNHFKSIGLVSPGNLGLSRLMDPNTDIQTVDVILGRIVKKRIYIDPIKLSQAINIIDHILVDYGYSVLSDQERSILFEASIILRDPEKQRKIEELGKMESQEGN